MEERGRQHEGNDVHRAITAQPPYPVVLTDVFMPVMDGLEATAAIRSSRVLSSYHQPFICALTVNAMTGDREMCLHAGIDGYLSKPVTLDTLCEALNRGWEHWQQREVEWAAPANRS